MRPEEAVHLYQQWLHMSELANPPPAVEQVLHQLYSSPIVTSSNETKPFLSA